MNDLTDKTASEALPSTTRSLPIALIRARERVMGPIREMLADTGITEQQWRVLRVLSEFGPQDATSLSVRTSLLLPSQTRIIQSMVEKGYVSRVSHDTDRRRLIVNITPAGQEIILKNEARASEIAQSFVQALGEERFETLLDILGDLERL